MCRWCRTWCAARWRWTIPPTCRPWPTARSRCCGSGDIEIAEVEDHFTNTSAGGYRDFQINFRLPRTRVIGELQLHVKDLLVVKQRVGHGVYERARLACAAMEMGITNAEVSAVCTRNAERDGVQL